MLLGHRIFEIEAHGHLRRKRRVDSDYGGVEHFVAEHICLAWPYKVRTKGCTAIGPRYRHRRGLVEERQSCEVDGVRT